MRPGLLGIGGAHSDRLGRVGGPFMPGASNPGTMRETTGGGVFNALRTAMRLDVSASLISVRGGDAAGQSVEAALQASGIADGSAVFLDRRTASYTAILSQDGDVIAALADMAIYDAQFARSLRRKSARTLLAAADAVIIDANLPEAAIAQVFDRAPVHAIAVSPAKAVRLRGYLGQLETLFMNRREAAALTGLAENADASALISALGALGLRQGVITNGAGPVAAFSGADTLSLIPPPTSTPEDVTGAGDALAGAAVAALANGMAFAEALRRGIAAATLALRHTGAAADFTPAEFSAMLDRIGQPTAN